MIAESSTDDVPTVVDVAAALDVEQRRLLRFVDYHPDPTAPRVLGWAAADPRHRAMVADWLAAYRYGGRGE